MKIKEIMTTEMVVAQGDDTILEVAKLMNHHNIGCVPVVEENKILGVITDRDIVLNIAEHDLNPKKTFAKEIASKKIFSVKQDDDVEKALELMKKHRIRRIPVTNKSSLVGIVSIGDIAVHTNFNVEVGEALIEISKPSKVENV